MSTISTHFEMLMPKDEQEKIGATPNVTEHLRVMRALAEYADIKDHRDILQRELTAAQARIAELETQIEAHAWKVSPAMAQAKIEHLIAHSARVQDANDRLTLQVTALERDKARLDWFDRAKSAEYSEGHCGWAINYVVTGDTLRAAIDQAMSAANEPNNLPHA